MDMSRRVCWGLAIFWIANSLFENGDNGLIALAISAIFGCAAMILDEMSKWRKL